MLFSGHVRKRAYKKDGRSWSRFIATAEIRDDAGERTRSTRSFERERDAKAWLAEQRARHDAGLVISAGGVTVSHLLDRWLAHIEQLGREPVTLRGYRKNIEYHLRPRLGSIALERLTPLHVQALIDELATNRSHRR